MLLKTRLANIWRDYVPKKHRASEYNGQLTILGRDLEMKGDFKLEGNLEVYGLIQGDIEMGDSHIFTAPGSKVRGNIVADTAEINGEINGDIHCRSVLQLGDTASIKGSISCGGLITTMGSNITGRVNTASLPDKDSLS